MVAAATPSLAQTPLPFPGASAPKAEAPSRARAPQPAVAAPAPARPAQTPAAPVVAGGNGPAAAAVGFAILPGAQFLGSYDAGKGQRYYLYGTSRPYAEVVAYYRTELRDRGDDARSELSRLWSQLEDLVERRLGPAASEAGTTSSMGPLGSFHKVRTRPATVSMSSIGAWQKLNF